jgi:serine/threonine protein phosphatase PrpC
LRYFDFLLPKLALEEEKMKRKELSMSMEPIKSEFIAGFLDQTGKKPNNKGYYGLVELPELACWIVADRVDSCVAKDSAQIAIEHIIGNFSKQPTISRRKIKEYLNAAHQKLKNESSYEMLKAGLVMAVTDYSKVIWAVIGNVRLYHFRQGKFNFRSKDQTIAQLMLDSGNLSEDEVNEREERNNLINYLGGATEFKPYISEPFRLQEGDVLLLCSMGIWEKMKNSEIAVLVNQTEDPKIFIAKLQAALAVKKTKGSKNYTVTAIFVKRIGIDKTGNYRQIIFKVWQDNLAKVRNLITKITS